MRSKKINTVKRITDAVLTVLLLFIMAFQVTGDTLHEWLGISMTVIVIVHHILNYKWYKALFKGRYTPYRIVLTLTDVLLLAWAFVGYILTRLLQKHTNKAELLKPLAWLAAVVITVTVLLFALKE